MALDQRCSACGAVVKDGVLRCKECGKPFQGPRAAEVLHPRVTPLDDATGIAFRVAADPPKRPRRPRSGLDFFTPALISHAQSAHIRSAYASLIAAMDDAPSVFADDPLAAELDGALRAWQKQEALKLAVVGLYHFWERRTVWWLRKRGRAIPKRAPGTFVEQARPIIEDVSPDRVSERTWCWIDESRRVVNAMKHGEPDAFVDLKNRFPNYFTTGRPELALEDAFEVGWTDFERIAQGFEDFWEALAPLEEEQSPDGT